LRGSVSFWSLWAPCYKRLVNINFYLPYGGERRFRRECLSFAAPVRGERLLDICCGDGKFTSLIAELAGTGGYVIGIDSAGNALEITSRALPDNRVSILRARAEALPFGNGRFDKCFICLGLHHMTQPFRYGTLREARRVLADGGKLFVFDFHYPDKKWGQFISRFITGLDSNKEAVSMVETWDLASEMEAAGLKVSRRKLIGGAVFQLLEAVSA